MKKVISIICVLLILIGAVGLAASLTDGFKNLGGNSNSTTEPNINTTTSDNTSDITCSLTEFRTEKFSHKFNSKDFQNDETGGFTSINGLIWEYPQIEYIANNSTKGIQLGTANRPHLEENPFYLKTSFDETCILKSLTIDFIAASQGVVAYEIYVNDLLLSNGSVSNTVSQPTIIPYLSEEIWKLEIKMFSPKSSAIYLKTLEIELDVPIDSDISLTSDPVEVPNE